MDNVDEFYVTLVCALIRELSKSQKQSLVMQLAEILARRAMASVDLSCKRTAEEAMEIAARLIRDTGPGRGRLSALPRVASIQPTRRKASKPRSLRAQLHWPATNHRGVGAGVGKGKSAGLTRDATYVGPRVATIARA